jgi:competence protein ComEC
MIQPTNEEILRISFKNVGQGDCILLEWKNEEDVWELAIIDCNKKGRLSQKNIDNVKAQIKEYGKVNFIFLSHPHFDHFSGLKELLDFCEEENIIVESIFDTALLVNESLEVDFNKKLFQSYLKQEKGVKVKSLVSLFETFQYWETQKGALRETFSNASLMIDIPKKLRIYTLSPTSQEAKSYLLNALERQDDGTLSPKSSTSDANILSTIICIETPLWQILLTSDAVTSTFSRLLNIRGRSANVVTNGTPLIALQVPHHGSEKNHNVEFWDTYIGKETVSFISSGQNKIYKHPNEQVVDYFHKKTKTVHATNNVHGFNSYFSKSTGRVIDAIDADFNSNIISTDDRIINALDTELNPKMKESDDCGEQLFRITESGDYRVVTNPNRPLEIF